MNKIAFIFPGQGTQFPGMDIDLINNCRRSKEIIDEACNILGKTRDDIFPNNNSINNTSTAQIAIFLYSYIYYNSVISDTGIIPDVGAGHSLGEITALTCAGCIDFPDALRILSKRGELMECQSSKDKGTMAAVIGLDANAIDVICKENSNGNRSISIANYNSPNQIVISGSSEILEKSIESFRKLGGEVLELKVSGAFHSPYMESIKDEFARELDKYTFHSLRWDVVSSISGKLYTDNHDIKHELVRQLSSPVRWTKALETVDEFNIDIAYEIGPGSVLANLMKKNKIVTPVFSIKEGISESIYTTRYNQLLNKCLATAVSTPNFCKHDQQKYKKEVIDPYNEIIKLDDNVSQGQPLGIKDCRHILSLTGAILRYKNALNSNNILENIAKTCGLSDSILFEKNQRGSSLATLFENRADLQPDDIAILCNNCGNASRFLGTSITYSDLNKYANKLARIILQKTKKKNSVVSIMLESSIEMVIALLGVLKSGHAFLPINPEDPTDRISYLMKNSDSSIVISRNMYAQKTVNADEIIDIGILEKCKESSLNIDKDMEPEDLSYVIYTSGTTGKPKGVPIYNRSITRTIEWRSKEYRLTREDKTLQLFSYTFDGFITSLFTPLVSGAKIVMANRFEIRDIHSIKKLIIENGITHFITIPSFYDAILDALEKKNLETLNSVVLAGEVLPLELIRKSKKLRKSLEIVNEYGPTENTVVTSIMRDCKANDENVRIGKSIPGIDIYIVDENNELVSDNRPGELLVGGYAVAVGYLNDKEATSKKFIQNPFSPQKDILFKTGDIVKIDHEGYMIFCSRKDRQIKINGYRVEPKEIEKSLLEIDDVMDAAVVLLNEENGNSTLAAFYVCKSGIKPNGAERVKETLSKLLPQYMIPSSFIPVNEIPRTEKRSVNIALLPGIAENISRSLLPARNEIERILKECWETVLGIKPIGTETPFLDLGGHSLSMMRIITKIHQEFQIKIDYNDFLECSTIKEMAILIESKKEDSSKAAYPEISFEKESHFEPFPLTNVQMAYYAGRNPNFELGGISTHGYLELETEIDINRFQEAINILIQRHPMLRAVVLNNGKQKIQEEVESYKIEVIDARNVNEKEQTDTILKFRDQLSHYVFNPEEYPLFMFKMVRLSEKVTYLFASFDLLMIDGASLFLLGRELDILCNNNGTLKDISFSYPDYIRGYYQVKNSPIYYEDRKFWLDQIDSFPMAPALPLTRNISEVKEPRFKRKEIFLDSAAWESLKKQANDHNITASTLLCAAYGKILSFWSGQEDFSINLTSFNRVPFHKDVDDIIGDFTSLLLLDFRTEEHEEFWKGAKILQTKLMNALQHNHFDGIEFIREIARKHNLGSQAIMPVVFTSMLFDEKNGWLNIGDIKYEISQTSQAYLDNQVKEVHGGLSIVWDYIDELLDPEMIESMFTQYIDLIQSVAQKTEIVVPQITLEDQGLYDQLNDTFVKIHEEKLLHDGFLSKTKKQPDINAIRFNNTEITYGELDLLSNNFANYLNDSHIRKGDSVAIIADPTIESVALILAVLKCGASFIPVDRSFPEDRIKFISENSMCKTLIDPLSLDLKYIRTLDDNFIPVKVSTEDIAYIIYTSGSTGIPKGVMISHGQAVNTIQCINKKFEICERDRILNLSLFSFDLSIFDIFGTLSAGAEIVLLHDKRDIKEIQKTIEQYGVTIWNSVPSVMEMYLSSVKKEGYGDSLRLTLLSGDWIPCSLPSKIHSHFPNSNVISLGGATECSIWSIYYLIEKNEEFKRSVPYGRPLDNQRFYVLDKKQNLCPPGVEGELYIGGKGVAAGYINNPEISNLSFLLHPEYGRIYRTGDFGILHRNGIIEFLGRKDQQVKIRGYRIELAEIEAAIQHVSGIQNCIVKDFIASNHQHYLAAFYTLEDESESVAEETLVEEISKKLPSYMLPNFFEKISSFNVNQNGKIDRKALSPEKLFSINDSMKSNRSMNSIQKEIKDIWSKIIGINNIDIDSNFFDIGGNSILLTQAFSEIEEKIGIDLNISDFFSYPSIKLLSEHISSIKGNHENDDHGRQIDIVSTDESEDIAVIGISGKFPDSENCFELWDVLINEKNCVKPLPKERKLQSDKYLKAFSGFPQSEKDIEYSTYAYLDSIDEFDSQFFKFSPKQADAMSPIQRLFMEQSWKCIEDAGYTMQSVKGSRTGVYIGYTVYEEDISYSEMLYKSDPESFSMGYSGVYLAMIPSRISYFLDLIGPTMLIDTACSSSLVSIHTACQGIKNGDCEMAIAGGARINLVPVGKGQIGIESPDNLTRTFDDSSDGTGFGEGVATVLLKPLSRALEDRDHVYGIIKGSGINQDGANSVSISAPNPAAQSELITKVLQESQIDPSSISYIEAHGTATNLGDPVEIKGITDAYAKFTNEKQFCGIGSIKTNFGHLLDCSGMASLFKVLLCFKHKRIPSSILFQKPNRKIDFINSPVYVMNKTTDWEPKYEKRRCAINSFGFSGTNCHLILDEPHNTTADSTEYYPFHFMLLSARSEKSLKSLVFKYIQNDYIVSDIDLYNACYVSQIGRSHHPYRLALIVKSKDDFEQKIKIVSESDFSNLSDDSIFYNWHDPYNKDERHEYYSEIMDKALQSYSMDNISKLCKAFVNGGDFDFNNFYIGKAYKKIPIAHTPLEKKKHWIPLPDDLAGNPYMIGGEPVNRQLVSNCLLKTFDQTIFYARIDVNKEWIMGEHIIFGNPMMVAPGYIELVLEAFAEISPGCAEVLDFEFSSPMISENYDPIDIHISFVKGDSGVYSVIVSSFFEGEWNKNALGRIRKIKEDKQELQSLDTLKKVCPVHLDPTPPSDLIQLSNRWYSSLGEIHANEEKTQFLTSIHLDQEYEMEDYVFYPSLIDVALNFLDHQDGTFFPYRYPSIKLYQKIPREFYSHVTAKKSDNKDLKYFDIKFISKENELIAEFTDYTILKAQEELLSMKTKELTPSYGFQWNLLENIESENLDSADIWLIFKDNEGQIDSLIEKLKNSKIRYIEVEYASEIHCFNPYHYTIPNTQEGHNHLVELLNNSGITFNKLLHGSSLDITEPSNSMDELESSLSKGVYSFFSIMKSLLEKLDINQLDIILLSRSSIRVLENDIIIPENVTLSGIGRSLEEEYNSLSISSIDIDSLSNKDDIDQLFRLITSKRLQYQVAIRQSNAYRKTLIKHQIDDFEDESAGIKEGNTYVITGGTGGIGLEVAILFCKIANVTLCLVNRSKMPERNLWASILKENKDSVLCHKIKMIQLIESNGSKVELYSADITDFEQAAQVISTVKKKHGKINGIVHSAGLGGKGLFIDKKREVFSSVMETKVKGAWILDKLTEDLQMDFMILFSSTIAIVGIEGQSDYTPGNSFLDSFAQLRRAKDKKTLSINWPGWKETGMAVNFNFSEERFQEIFFQSIGTNDAINALNILMNKKITNSIVSEVLKKISKQFYDSLEKSFDISNQISSKMIFDDSEDNHKELLEVILSGREDNEYTKFEIEIGNIWCNIFGKQELNIRESYFDLGGDSIIATVMNRYINGGVAKIDIVKILEYPTIEQLAAYIEENPSIHV